MKRKSKTKLFVEFRGVKYEIRTDTKHKKGSCGAGYCLAPFVDKPVISIDRREMEKASALEVMIHEALHACFWDMDEEAIEEAGKDIATFLTKMGVKARS